MNQESILSFNPSVPTGGGFAQRIVLRALAGMPHGQLTLVLPDRTAMTFGQRDRSNSSACDCDVTRRAPAIAAVINVRRAEFFQRCFLQGDIGFGEAFVAGDWDTPDLTAVIAWFLLNREAAPTLSGSQVGSAGLNLLRMMNRIWHRARRNSMPAAARNIREHYDLSNEFFALWLDPAMMYSSARWTKPDLTLEEAQRAKNQALGVKLRLAPHDHVLEIGTGWGGWSIQAARDHGCRVTTLTLSPSQRDLAIQRVAAAGLSHRIDVRLQDYRQLPRGEVYDKIVSIEMLEAVGHDYLKEWCQVVSRALKPDGLMALQFITCPDARYAALRGGVDFIQKHIFPGSLLLSVNRLGDLLARSGGFVLHHLDDFGRDYAHTLHLWREQFNAQQSRVQALGFDARFVRKWNYYLAYCEAAFAMRHISVVQTVHTRPNNLAL